MRKLKNLIRLKKIKISDYKRSPNLKIPLKQESILRKLKENKIPFSMDSSGENSTWSDPEKNYKRGRSKEDIIKNYSNCQMPCVSLMTSEDLENKQLAPKGAIFVCPI